MYLLPQLFHLKGVKIWKIRDNRNPPTFTTIGNWQSAEFLIRPVILTR